MVLDIAVGTWGHCRVKRQCGDEISYVSGISNDIKILEMRGDSSFKLIKLF